LLLSFKQEEGIVMLTPQAKEVLEKYQVRKSSREKREFRAWLRGELERAGWQTAEEGSFFSGHNVVVGDPDKAQVLFTAHYDTQAVLPFPNFITPRNLGIYLLYNLVICLGFFALAFLAGGLALLLPLPWYIRPWIPMGACIFCVWWMFFGRANRHTVNDNTSGVLTLLETALALPPEDRDKVCLVFFDNEERGMLGSSNFASKHKTVKKEKLVLNFDCVSDGESIQFFPRKALKREEETLDRLQQVFRTAAAGYPGKGAEVVRSFGFYPSDNASFRRACGVCALKKGRVGWYMDRIHTGKDTVLMEENIALLRDGCLELARETR